LDMIGDPARVTSCVYIPIKGEVNGVIFHILDDCVAAKLINVMNEFNFEKGTESLQSVKVAHPYAISCIEEYASMLTCAFLISINKFLGFDLTPGVPLYMRDMVGAILSSSLIASGYYHDMVTIVDVSLKLQEEKIESMVLFYLQQKELDKIVLSAQTVISKRIGGDKQDDNAVCIYSR